MSNDNVNVVRVTTSSYISGSKFKTVKEVRTMKRLSTGFDLLSEEMSNMGSDFYIENLNTVDDGLYILRMYNMSYDWETNHLDSYDLTLEPFERTLR